MRFMNRVDTDRIRYIAGRMSVLCIEVCLT